MPLELVTLSYLDRFGAQAVYGRPLGYHEIQRLIIAENIQKAYQDRAQSDNWAVWAQNNKRDNQLLIEAMRAADGGSED